MCVTNFQKLGTLLKQPTELFSLQLYVGFCALPEGILKLYE